MNAANVAVPSRRAFQFDDHEPLCPSGPWFGGSAFRTQLLNAYSLLLPDG